MSKSNVRFGALALVTLLGAGQVLGHHLKCNSNHPSVDLSAAAAG
jgi:hypothetical protein